MNNKSPLRYPGGKTRACKVIEGELLENCDLSRFKVLVSPFFGGGSFEFYMQNKYGLKVNANDKFEPLYTFWQTLKNEQEVLCEEVKKLKNITKEKFIDYRNKIMDLDDPLQQAAYYFVINRCSFSGSTLSGGYSQEASKKRFTNNSIKTLEDIDLSKIKFYNLDCIEFIEKKAKQKCLLFLDPPYFLDKKSKLYGNNGDMHENFDHDKLAEVLKTKTNWVLCYNNCDYIKDLYKDFKIIDTSWSYGMNKTKTSSEILIFNFDDT